MATNKTIIEIEKQREDTQQKKKETIERTLDDIIELQLYICNKFIAIIMELRLPLYRHSHDYTYTRLHIYYRYYYTASQISRIGKNKVKGARKKREL